MTLIETLHNVENNLKDIKYRSKLMTQKTLSIKLAVLNDDTRPLKTIADDINKDLKDQSIHICELEDTIKKLEVMIKYGENNG
jgi:hypothetical protein